MDQELTIEQVREIARLRRRNPGAELRVHHKPWGLIVEVRRGGHAVELERFDWTGGAEPDRPLGLAA
ncbi:MAG: hypothetical protein QOG11_285 [Solirubrobacteraceae bacterium]|nr:hypothetical protein [Solirubrobacteraceae bacterium]